jgi:ADP-ribosylglycohydrolase
MSWSLDRNMGPYNVVVMGVQCVYHQSLKLAGVMKSYWILLSNRCITHNHPEGIKGAQVTALAIY